MNNNDPWIGLRVLSLNEVGANEKTVKCFQCWFYFNYNFRVDKWVTCFFNKS